MEGWTGTACDSYKAAGGTGCFLLNRLVVNGQPSGDFFHNPTARDFEVELQSQLRRQQTCEGKEEYLSHLRRWMKERGG